MSSKNAFFYIILIFFISSCKKEKEETPKPPNIIWLMAEDISLDLACYGMAAVKTPNLDQMAHDGMMFNNAFVTNPICSPSRSAMMVGVHQVKTNSHHHRSNRNVALSAPYKPLTYWLRQAGYTTILGHHSVRGKGRKIDVNFKHEALGKWDGIENFGLFDKHDYFDLSDTPFFAQIQLNVTHRGDWWDEIRAKSADPVRPDSVKLPPYFADHPIVRLDWAKYLDQIEYMDYEVGMIFKELEKKGIAENTVVIFIGDNGRCNIRGKGYLYDPGLRIPLLIRWPKGIRAGQIRNEVVSATDITATILDMAGVEQPAYMTGMSLMSDNFKRNEVYAARDLWDEVEEHSRAITTDKWKYIRNDKSQLPWDAHQAYLEFYRPAVHIMRSLNIAGKLNEQQRLFFHPEKPLEELYDLKNDPFELNNLVSSEEHSTILESFRKTILEYDEKMRPISGDYEAVHPIAVDLLEWVKMEKPDKYKQMISGVEIGFQHLLMEYKASKEKTK